MARAFTLVEVLVVVMIIGIASAIVVPGLIAPGTFGVQAAARSIVADILYAQSQAIAKQEVRKVVFDVPNNKYCLTDADGKTLDNVWRSGGGEGYTVSFKEDRRFSGVTLLSAKFGDGSTLAFDEMGGPAQGGSVELGYNGAKYKVTVTAFTGRVTVAKEVPVAEE